MTTDRKRFGEILVANGTISEKTLQRALTKAKREKKRIGETLENMEVATGEEIAAALAEQYRCKTVKNFADYSYSAELLSITTVDTVTRHLLFPLKMENKKLFLAMVDPTDTKVVANLAKNKELTIIPFIASRIDIIAAINKHYLRTAPRSDNKQTVLLVEDNSVVCNQMENVLSREGFRVVAAKNGMEAFKKAISETPAVIVTDKEMPIFDGYKLLESLKSLQETRRIPVILLTASLDGNEEAAAFDRGFFDFIAKPVKDVTLVARIKRAMLSFEGMGH